MNKIHYFFVSALFFLLFASGCAITREQRLQRDYNDFREWISAQSEQVENQTEESWKQVRAEFRTRTANLDQQVQHLSRELKEEYKTLKKQFEELDEEQERLRLQAKWRNDLLEDAADTSSITSESLWQAYATFMSNVRLRHKKWEEDDWKMAHEVYRQLAKRQEEVYAGVTTEDQIRIKSLQMEYHALRTKAEEEEEGSKEKEKEKGL